MDPIYKISELDGEPTLVETKEEETPYKVSYIEGRIVAYEEAAVAKQAEADRYKAMLAEYDKLKPVEVIEK